MVSWGWLIVGSFFGGYFVFWVRGCWGIYEVFLRFESGGNIFDWLCFWIGIIFEWFGYVWFDFVWLFCNKC